MNGLVLIDKPAGCTSHDVVNRWRKLADTKRVGHLGTLDPMATGLLALITGNGTRLAQFFAQDEKTYVAEVKLGWKSDTYDIEGELVPTNCPIPEQSETITAALQAFTGRFLQTPPPVSAKKIGGVPAYKLVRKQVPVQLTPVEVEVKSLKVEGISEDLVSMTITCSSGTYIRGIAHDLGQKLGCGGVLSKLRRTAVGTFSIEGAHSLDELMRMASEGRVHEAVIPAAQLLPQFPATYLDNAAIAQIRQGRDFRTSPFVVAPGTPYVKALSSTGELVAIGELRIPNLYHPSTVL